MIKNEIFEDLFVLEMASNHQGSVERAFQIVSAFSKVIRLGILTILYTKTL
jgi:sialic acid synthase SpsE